MKKPSTLDVLLMLVPDEEKQKAKAALAMVQFLAPALPVNLKCFPTSNYGLTGLCGVALTAERYKGNVAFLRLIVQAIHKKAEVFLTGKGEAAQLNIFIPTDGAVTQ
jgi:hypothetical protein